MPDLSRCAGRLPAPRSVWISRPLPALTLVRNRSAAREHRRPTQDSGITMQLASDAGPTDVPLLDETIGANLARTVAAHGDGEALVARHQGIRWTYAEFGERVARCARGLIGARPRARRPGRAVEPQLRRVDAAAVRHRGDRRHPRQHQPGLPHPRAGLRPQPVGLPDRCSPPRRSRRPTTSTWSSRSRPTCRPSNGRSSSGRTTGTSWWPAPAAPARDDDLAARRAGCAPTTRSTSSTRRARPASPRAPRSPTATS